MNRNWKIFDVIIYTDALFLICRRSNNECTKAIHSFWINLYYYMGKFSRRQIADMFLIFHRKHDFMQRKQDLTFHAICLQWRQFAWNVKSCFLEKIRKTKQTKCYLLKFLSRVLSVKLDTKTYQFSHSYTKYIFVQRHQYIFFSYSSLFIHNVYLYLLLQLFKTSLVLFLSLWV